MRRRLILAAAAMTLAVSIWSMHFVGMLAARFPVMVGFRVLPTLVSLLICVLVVGAGVLIVHTSRPKAVRITGGAVAMGAGIATMHYVGMSAINGCELQHSLVYVVASTLVAIVASGLGLWQIEGARKEASRRGASAAILGIAISGMHYTAMAGLTAIPFGLSPPSDPVMPHDIMAIVVAVVSFLISGGFLLSLTPDRQVEPMVERDQPVAPAADRASPPGEAAQGEPVPPVTSSVSALGEKLAQQETAFARQVEVQKDNRSHRLAVSSIAFVRANGHYTLVSDGEQEFFCQSTIGEIEALLDPALFMRVHRSYIVSIGRIEAVRRAGDGGIAEIDAQVPHIIPVARGRFSAVKKRLMESHG